MSNSSIIASLRFDLSTLSPRSRQDDDAGLPSAQAQAHLKRKVRAKCSNRTESM